jgi:hypothetical protein
MTDKPDTPATPVKTMTTEEAREFILSMPKERLIAALDGIRAELAEKEKKK